MARSAITAEQKKREGAFVRQRYEHLKKTEKDLTLEILADEIECSHSLVSQWLNGTTAIPDKRLMWLGGRLRFDPFELRPSLQEYFFAGLQPSGRARTVAEIVKYLTETTDDDFARLSAIIGAYLGRDSKNPK